MKPLGVGVIGCGNISEIYLKNLGAYPQTEVIAVADLDAEKARAKAEKHKVLQMPVDELLTSPSVELVLNLTVPKAHFGVAKAALEAGRHVYNEKPLALNREEGKELLALAESKGLRIGAAPDTFLGAGLQACRKIVDAGQIGRVVAGQAFMMCHGHESWHPSPEFYYEAGGGPLFDMGPYYITALASLIGPVERVTAIGRKFFETRTITSQPKAGKIVPVEVPTHLVAILEFAQGAVIELTTSFDVWHHTLPPITLHGSDGSLLCGDPNGFGELVSIRTSHDKDWRSVPLASAYAENSRGVGVQDIACALQEGREHRANGRLAYHVLDVMQAIRESAEGRSPVTIASTIERPEAMPPQGV